PAEHLDHNGGQDHEADQHPEPQEVPAAVELGGHPDVGAPVQEKVQTPTTEKMKSIQEYVGEGRALHDEPRGERPRRRRRRRRARYGFVVEFDDPRDADDAVYDLNGKELCGERGHCGAHQGTPS
ncbi:hypothetical protein INR49_006775, partial [Caranx melampygus]